MKTKIHNIFTHNILLQIVSCFLIFAVLSNLIYLPCYFYVKSMNRKTVMDHLQYQLENGMDTLDTSIEASFNLSNTLSMLSSQYRGLYYERADFDDLALNLLRNTVSNYLLPFGDITEFGLTADDTLLFTKSRIYYELDPLSFAHYFSCEDEDYLSSFSGSYCVLPATLFSTYDRIQDYEAITMGWRWYKSNMYFFAHYSLDDLFALFASPEALESCYLAIYCGDQLLAENGSPLPVEAETLTATSSNQLNIRVLLMPSDSYLQQNMTHMTQLVRIFITAVLLATFLWILVFTLLMWRPFRNIHKALHSTGHLPAENAGKFFTNALISDITRLGTQLSDYEHLLEEQKERMRTHIFEKALYRGVYSEEAQASFYGAFPDFPGKWRLAQIQYAKELETGDFETETGDFATETGDFETKSGNFETEVNEDTDLGDAGSGIFQSILLHQLQSGLPDLLLLPQDQDTLLVLVPLPQEGRVDETLKDLCRLVGKQHHFSVSILFSRAYEDPVFLVDALQELEYEGFSTASQVQSLSIQQLQAIYSALQCGDDKTAIHVLKSGTARMLATGDQFAAQFTHRLLNCFLIHLKLENNSLLNIPIPTYRPDKIRKLYEEKLPECFTQIAGCLKQQHAEETEKLNQDILDFIQANLTNQQLSVTLVAEEFHISAPTLQKRISTCTHMTFSAYVETARMEKARQLLKDTNATVKEIAEETGYISTNSFYRAYKRRYGEPPLTYRNQEETPRKSS